MVDSQLKCIILLSTKSSGSSALQYYLAKIPGVNHIQKTRHNEHETLFWTKAASVLGLEQIDIWDSEVPINKTKARKDLVTLLQENLDFYKALADNELIFEGWRLLCQKYSPVFIEKSPHHLYQWSNLELIIKCIERCPDIKFLIVVLIRNPMDTLYSMWNRWRGLPERNQHQWLIAYRNILKFKELLKNNLVIIKYEDMIKDGSCMKQILEFIGSSSNLDGSKYFHKGTIGKWKKDKFFGFQLDPYIITLAEEFGYKKSDMLNNHHHLWPYYRHFSRSLKKTTRIIIKIPKKYIKKELKHIMP